VALRGAWLLLAAALLPGIAAVAADEAEEARARLKALGAEIEQLSEARRQRQAARSSAQAQLQASEKALAEINRELGALRQRIDATREELSALESRREDLEAASRQQEGAVMEELRRAWQGTGDGPLKLLLNQDDPQAVARLLAYYRYILDARSTLLDSYREKQAALAEVAGTLAATRSRQAEQEQALAERGQALALERARRQQSLAEIEEALANDAQLLAQRRQDREQLEQLLADIEEALAAAAPALEDMQPFSAARGQMPWPVQGRVTHRFGEARNQGKMRWQGVRLRAEAGTPINAIHHGRVVYADWLRGSGLLLVIDHGEGFMSLYAHNETLLREVGDWVSAGAPVATVGDSGGQSEAALYFEIRKDGKPTNPQSWCRG
jgi:septal ring factor EnvC (AmiA/AmiB activator)